MKLEQYLNELIALVKHNHKIAQFEVIYSHDDEGSEFQKVNHIPSLMEISNIEDNRHLEQVYDVLDREGTNFNAIIIN